MSKINLVLQEIEKLSPKERMKLVEKVLEQTRITSKTKENSEWEMLTVREFLAGYGKKDSIYDKL